ncbi:hypothetical protein GCM10022224_011350 [Nonomuraea antimicrobica]|uniref:Transcription regulator HTH AraC- type ligand binding domain-containing protein n=1 Tax=Nonomuraea antimicrobica TaxID=561173 RepID=A0ABP7B768_9ACTN
MIGVSVETVVRTAVLPARERFDFWREMVCQLVVPVEVRSDDTTDFDATIRVIDLARMQASMLDFPRVEGHRSTRLIRRSDPEIYYFAVCLRGTTHISQRGRTVALQPHRPCSPTRTEWATRSRRRPSSARCSRGCRRSSAGTCPIPACPPR